MVCLVNYFTASVHCKDPLSPAIERYPGPKNAKTTGVIGVKEIGRKKALMVTARSIKAQQAAFCNINQASYPKG
jgi:hypothetical protein